ncbi:hypothetical protein [Bradyrhizobium sp. CCBAU 51745]|uniref:hypothetical protein n=1 Tax=Bradyrhizobium sp. CCBAU 51745 TaxID=1325099 RepID=UPI002304F9BC|nr:hypothetical protein [Bradyrhizobium sp. CCBAU 51745]
MPVALSATTMRMEHNPSPIDDTTLVQRLIETEQDVVIPCGRIVKVTGLTTPSIARPVSIHGECPTATLQITENAPAISCRASSELFTVRDLTIVGTSPESSARDPSSKRSDAGQVGIRISSCSKVRIENVQINNIAGTGLDLENAMFAFSTPQMGIFSNISGANNFRLIHAHNFSEYLGFSNVQADNNVIGVEIESGNVTFSNSHFRFNTIGIKIDGRASQNPCHGSFNGGSANHNVHNLVVQSCGLGEVFNGVDFLGDQGGGITKDSVGIQIYNSRGITIANGQIGSNIEVGAADPVTGLSSSNGPNALFNNYIRSDLSNFIPPRLESGAILLKKGNYDASGLVPWND